MMRFSECLAEALDLGDDGNSQFRGDALFVFTSASERMAAFDATSRHLQPIIRDGLRTANELRLVPAGRLDFRIYEIGRLNDFRGRRWDFVAVQDGVPQVAQDFLLMLMPRDGKSAVHVFSRKFGDA